MRKFARIFMTLAVCFVTVTSLGRMHTDEELAALNKRYEDLQRTLDGLSKNLDGESLLKYRPLRRALDAYVDTHAHKEASFAGSGWAEGVSDAKQSVQKEFIDLFKKLDSKQLPKKSELDFKKTDSELNRIYQEIQNNKNFDSEVAAAVTRRGIKESQRKWIKYRDAWLAFATVRFPTVSKHSLSAALTEDRISKLVKIPKEQ